MFPFLAGVAQKPGFLSAVLSPDAVTPPSTTPAGLLRVLQWSGLSECTPVPSSVHVYVQTFFAPVLVFYGHK